MFPSDSKLNWSSKILVSGVVVVVVAVTAVGRKIFAQVELIESKGERDSCLERITGRLPSNSISSSNNNNR